MSGPHLRVATVLLALVATLAACGGSDADDPEEPTGSEVVLRSVGTDIGEVVTDGDGNTLYLLVTDRRADPTCIEECAGLWSPILHAADIDVGEGVDADLVGSVTREDGEEQLTYNSWPLYRYRGDAQTGDIEGHGQLNVWFAMGTHGEAVGITE